MFSVPWEKRHLLLNTSPQLLSVGLWMVLTTLFLQTRPSLIQPKGQQLSCPGLKRGKGPGVIDPDGELQRALSDPDLKSLSEDLPLENLLLLYPFRAPTLTPFSRVQDRERYKVSEKTNMNSGVRPSLNPGSATSHCYPRYGTPL